LDIGPDVVQIFTQSPRAREPTQYAGQVLFDHCSATLHRPICPSSSKGRVRGVATVDRQDARRALQLGYDARRP
jgi:hypothetical protein